MNTTKLLFSIILILSTLIVITSESWIGMWMGLEINMISFLLLLHMKNKDSSESCMIYFLIQTLGSILMLMSILSSSLIMLNPEMIKELMKMMLMFSMLIKLGGAPFHFWLPEMLNKQNWMNSLILMTWQKIAPLYIMSNIIQIVKFLSILILINVIVGSIGGLNQTSLLKILGFSSINHMGWMMACMKFNNQMWFIYLIIYSLLLFMLTTILNIHSSYNINQLANNSTFLTKLLISTLFLSLGGLPPFMGFYLKWLVMKSMIISMTFFTLFIMILSSLIILFYYIRISNTMILMNSIHMKWTNSKTIMSIYIFSTMNILNLILPLTGTLGF